MGATGPRAGELQTMIFGVSFVIPELLIRWYVRRCWVRWSPRANAFTPVYRVQCGTCKLGGLVPVSPEVVESSIRLAASALEGSVVDGFGMALELGTWEKWLSTFLANVGLGVLDWAVEIWGFLVRSFAHGWWTGWRSRRFGRLITYHSHRGRLR